jgi:hypothetical protein
MVSDVSRRWVEAAKMLARDPTTVVTCPERNDGTLVVRDEVSVSDPTMIDRYLICDRCGARNVIRMRSQKR